MEGRVGAPQEPQASGGTGASQAFNSLRVSNETKELLCASWRKSTKQQYAVYITKWTHFCEQRQINHLQPDIEHVLDFLTELYHRGGEKGGLGYSAINTARSALSTIIRLEGKPVGQHFLVIRLLQGIFNSRPTFPKNIVTWDPEVLLRFLKQLSPVKKLCMKLLTFKAVTLLWLLTGQRGQSMHVINVKNVTLNENVLKIRYGDLLN